MAGRSHVLTKTLTGETIAPTRKHSTLGRPMRQTVVGILAHVDAGKTTLAEAMLFDAGTIRTCGRVDRGDSHLDTDLMERDRGITIFSSQAALVHAGTAITLVDSPGHVDFSAEAERTLAALDLAVLVVGANDGVQGHTRTLWRLLERHGIPTIIFANKVDLLPDAGSLAEKNALVAALRAKLSEGCLPIEELTGEAAAMTDETALEEFLETGELGDATTRRLFAERHVFPCLFGSALKNEGVAELLNAIAKLAPDRAWPGEFAARVYRVSRGDRGERIAWLKITGGELHARQQVDGVTDGIPWSEKINELRIYTGSRFEPISNASAGGVCAVTGLSHVRPGDALGAEPAPERPTLAPVLTYGVLTGGADIHTVLSALRELAEEDPMLAVSWDEHLQEIRLRLMGAVQLEVVRDLMARRFGLDIDFGPGSILYKETNSRPVMGVGHFEPLRHYAEVHLRLDPAPRGSGVAFGSECCEDDLDRNWQRLILTNAQERELVGVLTGAPVTDVRITLVGGRAHLKHTEGGDFRQATYRAMRQALMTARELGECMLLEPWYAFELELPWTRSAVRCLTSRGCPLASALPSRWVTRLGSQARFPRLSLATTPCSSPNTQVAREGSPSSSPAMSRVTIRSTSLRKLGTTRRQTFRTPPTPSSAVMARGTPSSGMRCRSMLMSRLTRRGCVPGVQR